MSAHPETAPYRSGFSPSGPLADRRREAFARFEELGFPTRRDEAWRFTNLRPLQERTFPPRGAESGGTPDFARFPFVSGAARIVLANGELAQDWDLRQERGLPKGTHVGVADGVARGDPTLAQNLIDHADVAGGQAFVSLNAALLNTCVALIIDDNVLVDRPIQIVHWADLPDKSFHPRNLIRIGAGNSATVIETYIGAGRYWTNAVTRVELEPGAMLRHIKIQDESTDAIHFGQVRAELARDARYESFVLTLGGRLSRHDSFVKYTGEGAACGLFGAYLLRGEQEATNATFVDHAVPRCTTKEVFKGVVDEKAHGVFLGKIAVRPQAQKTNAHQLNKNLLLSTRAAVDTKPELEILADDVKCSHGATVGDLDEAALFYLEARGIPALEARRLLIEAFAADAIDQIEDDAALRGHLAGLVQHWLGRGAQE